MLEGFGREHNEPSLILPKQELDSSLDVRAFEQEGIRSMYEVSGQKTISSKSIERYLKDKEDCEKEIVELASIDVVPDINKINNMIAEDFEKIFSFTQSEQRAELIKTAFATTNFYVQLKAAEMISSVPQEQQIELIKKAFTASNPYVQLEAVKQIFLIPAEKRAELQEEVLKKIQEVLNSDEFVIHSKIPEMISYLSKEKQGELSEMMFQRIQAGLISGDPDTKLKAAEMMWSIPREKQTALEEVVLKNVHEGLNSTDSYVQLKAAEMISSAPYWQRVELIKKALLTSNPSVQLKAVDQIWLAEEQAELFSLAQQTMSPELLIASPLYNQTALDNEAFARTKFPKTGSETTLVGGKLKDRVIIRHIEPRAFLAWQKLYENYQIWKDNGLDYIPIEPIASFRLNKEGMVDVATGVLDLSLRQWYKRGGVFADKLQEKAENIKSILDSIGFTHGHAHADNFCLRFFRNEKGEVDLSKEPRVYLIDFDQSNSPK